MSWRSPRGHFLVPFRLRSHGRERNGYVSVLGTEAFHAPFVHCHLRLSNASEKQWEDDVQLFLHRALSRQAKNPEKGHAIRSRQ
jgi:hypothetical protein